MGTCAIIIVFNNENYEIPGIDFADAPMISVVAVIKSISRGKPISNEETMKLSCPCYAQSARRSARTWDSKKENLYQG